MAQVFLSVCDKTKLSIAGKDFDSSANGMQIQANVKTLANDIAEVEVPDLGGWKFRVGLASKISHFSIIVCNNRRTAIPNYSDPAHILKCCACCEKNGSTWCVYGDSGCVCC